MTKLTTNPPQALSDSEFITQTQQCFREIEQTAINLSIAINSDQSVDSDLSNKIQKHQEGLKAYHHYPRRYQPAVAEVISADNILKATKTLLALEIIRDILENQKLPDEDRDLHSFYSTLKTKANALNSFPIEQELTKALQKKINQIDADSVVFSDYFKSLENLKKWKISSSKLLAQIPEIYDKTKTLLDKMDKPSDLSNRFSDALEKLEKLQQEGSTLQDLVEKNAKGRTISNNAAFIQKLLKSWSTLLSLLQAIHSAKKLGHSLSSLESFSGHQKEWETEIQNLITLWKENSHYAASLNPNTPDETSLANTLSDHIQALKAAFDWLSVANTTKEHFSSNTTHFELLKNITSGSLTKAQVENLSLRRNRIQDDFEKLTQNPPNPTLQSILDELNTVRTEQEKIIDALIQKEPKKITQTISAPAAIVPSAQPPKTGWQYHVARGICAFLVIISLGLLYAKFEKMVQAFQKWLSPAPAKKSVAIINKPVEPLPSETLSDLPKQKVVNPEPSQLAQTTEAKEITPSVSSNPTMTFSSVQPASMILASEPLHPEAKKEPLALVV